ncbi:MAG TPA: hypothetical protein VF895_11525 [Gaiellaceae bacterium]
MSPRNAGSEVGRAALGCATVLAVVGGIVGSAAAGSAEGRTPRVWRWCS